MELKKVEKIKNQETDSYGKDERPEIEKKTKKEENNDNWN